MPPLAPLPLHPRWSSPDEYVSSLLQFVTTTDLFRNLCGGVHILDFITREPDIYSWVLPQEWRDWFEIVDLHDFLHLLLREDLDQFQNDKFCHADNSSESWRSYPSPPVSLIRYIDDVRTYSLRREFESASPDTQPLPRHISVGMKPKKVHEVKNFAAYVDELSSSLPSTAGESISVVDFGSGQNYLGRTLACPPYNKHVVAIEQRHHNVEGARTMDIHAKLAKKEKVMRNKKEYKRQIGLMKDSEAPLIPPSETPERSQTPFTPTVDSGAHTPVVETILDTASPTPPESKQLDPHKGSMTYIEHALESGHLEGVLRRAPSMVETQNPTSDPAESLVVSIHSCGNLTHHGLRSITLNPSVKAVAMIGCCYNLLTERLGPATYKHPQLRPNHPRLIATGSTYDPHGFPMSRRLENFEYEMTIDDDGHTRLERSVRLNITARMMAVQAPYNWGRADTESYITRHFYRALLQRILLDRGVVRQAPSGSAVDVAGGSLSGKDTEGTPLIIGSLRKAAFVSFPAYVRAALHKLTKANENPDEGEMIASLTADLVEDTDDAVSKGYEQKYWHVRKRLGLIWSLMAFSAGVIESVIVVDRWLWLTEQPEVGDAWVEAVFDYAQSPRNMCVVGIKKADWKDQDQEHAVQGGVSKDFKESGSA